MDTLSSAKLQILQHSLGVDEYGRGSMYRNHFCAGESDIAACRELVSIGYMHEFPEDHSGVCPYPTFSVTEAGIKAMREASPNPPKRTRSQQRYDKWLEVRDVYPDMTFGEWLKQESEVQGGQ